MKDQKQYSGGSERTFMSGVLVLTLSTIIVKIIGLAYKIPLLSVLGAEGMGYFNTSYEIFALLCGVSTSGTPVAVSMLVSAARESKSFERARGIYKTASALLLTKGVLFSGLLAIFAQNVARAVGNREAYLAILAISPALLFCCVSGAVRGYFQGCRLMTPTAASQLTEAVGKLLFGVLFAYFGVKAGLGVPLCAALAVLGVSLGELISALYLFVRKQIAFSHEGAVKGAERPKRGYVLALMRISLPITMCSLLIGSTRMIDMTLMLRRLDAIGLGAAQANKIYGVYTTLALPVYGLVPAFIPPITESLIPRLAAAVECGSRTEQTRAVKGAARLTAFLAVPAAAGVTVYSRDILCVLFAGQKSAVELCAPLLSALGISVFFACMISMTNAVLQSYRKTAFPIISLALGALIKAVFAYALIGNPQIGALGAPYSTLASNIAIFALNCIFLKRVLPRGTGIMYAVWKPLGATAIAMPLSLFARRRLGQVAMSSSLAFMCAFAVALAAYFTLSVMLGVVGKDDIQMFGKSKSKIKEN